MAKGCGLPQSGHAESTSLCPHRRKLCGVGNVLVIALKLNRSSPLSKPWMRRRQERSECIASVHSNHQPWTANCLSAANWLSVSISMMMLRMRFRWPEHVDSNEADWVAGSGGFASQGSKNLFCASRRIFRAEPECHFSGHIFFYLGRNRAPRLKSLGAKKNLFEASFCTHPGEHEHHQ